MQHCLVISFPSSLVHWANRMRKITASKNMRCHVFWFLWCSFANQISNCRTETDPEFLSRASHTQNNLEYEANISSSTIFSPKESELPRTLGCINWDTPTHISGRAPLSLSSHTYTHTHKHTHTHTHTHKHTHTLSHTLTHSHTLAVSIYYR